MDIFSKNEVGSDMTIEIGRRSLQAEVAREQAGLSFLLSAEVILANPRVLIIKGRLR